MVLKKHFSIALSVVSFCALVGCGISVEDVRKIEDQNELFEIAIGDYDYDIKYAATEKLTDVNLLEKVAVRLPNSSAKLEAIRKLRAHSDTITNQAVLAEMACFGVALDGAKSLVAKISNDELLREVGTCRRKPGNLSALKKIKNQTILYEITQDDDVTSENRRHAVWALVDLETLKKIAENDDSRFLQSAAYTRLLDLVDQIDDEQWLFKIAQNLNRAVAVEKMVARIQSQDLLIKLAASKDHHYKAREAASLYINDQRVLAGLVTGDSSGKVRANALANLTDEKFLAVAAVNAKSDVVGREFLKKIVKKVTKQEHLKTIYRDASELNVRRDAVQRISDNDFLKTIFRTDAEPKLRLDAIRQISDQDFLKETALSESEPKLRHAAIYGLTDRKFLKQLAQNNQNFAARVAAAGRIYQLDFPKARAGEHTPYIQALLLDKGIIAHYGELIQLYNEWSSNSRYSGGSTLVIEYKDVKVVDTRGTIVAHVSARGSAGETARRFSYDTEYSRASISFAAVCAQLLRPLTEDERKNLLPSTRFCHR